ncbi:MAG: glycoside hydrolase family 38 C-terminal domain-containing protein, partial [bacterium]|nr:glycoside hydrolase family 38 C-terminal domain-containing protein [bacterium]
NETEALAASASIIAGSKREPNRLDRSWRNILFNHFHDILPGSGVVETREFALGRFQETLANVGTYATTSMRRIAEKIDTTSIEYDDEPETYSEGGGVGFNGATIQRYHMPSTERGRGKTRVIHVFNPTAYVRDELTSIVVWDYTYDLGMIEFVDASGNPVEFTVLESGKGYWWHSYTKFLVKVKIPAYGYTTVVLRPNANDGHLNLDPGVYTRGNEVLEDFPVVLENDCIRATFDCVTMELVELYDKKTNETLISEPSCYFRLITESTKRGMTSWKIGPYCQIVNLNRTSRARLIEESHGDLFSKMKYEIKFGRSWLVCTVSLKKGSPVLEFENIINWKEEGDESTIPQLNFAVPVSYRRNGKFHCDIPFGYIERKNQNSDVPALTYIGLCGESEHKIAVMCDSKYGYRVTDEMAALTLMHTATNPDPCSDSGEQFLTIGIAAAGLSEMKEISDKFNHPMPHIASIRHEGTLPLEGTPISVSGDIKVSAVKVSEDGEGTAIRVYDDLGSDKKVVLAVSGGIESAYYADTCENKLADIPVSGGKVEFTCPAHDFVTVIVK